MSDRFITAFIGNLSINREPWTRLSDSERIDHLPPLVDALVELALSDTANPDANLDLLRSAFAHGRRALRRHHPTG